MEDLFLTIFVKPFVLLVFLILVRAVAMIFERFIPDGRVKRILFSPLPGHRNR